MDVYGPSPPDLFRVDDLLDFSNDDLFSPNSSTAIDSEHLLHHHHQDPISDNTSSSTSTTTTNDSYFSVPNPNFRSTDDFTIPNDDVAELEWLSNFVDESFTDFPANPFAGMVNLSPGTAFQGRCRSKRSRTTLTNPTKRGESRSVSTSRDRSAAVDVPRRCTHCASEKTPQWRTGPLGPKTLCNACGVRYKSGRLVPEYRPAASPTFVLTQHSNSHRKVLELRRQKELLLQQQQQQMQIHQQQQQQQEQHLHGLHHFQVC